MRELTQAEIDITVDWVLHCPLGESEVEFVPMTLESYFGSAYNSTREVVKNA